jgi:hypothetical protein
MLWKECCLQTFKEEITGTSEVRETFKISKIGTIAGLYGYYLVKYLETVVLD